MLVYDGTIEKNVEEKEIKKHEIESDTNLEMPNVSQELLGCRIFNFEPELKIC